MLPSRRKKWALAALGVLGVALYFNNASWLAPAPEGQAVLLAHRGVHQLYRRENLSRDDCTANRILPVRHSLIENTLPSMRASFAAGADMLELDVHPTTDGEFAVFHDWTIDCRTEGQGVTREHSMAYLRTLDVGYGYTADGGRTFPLRGQGVGMMPTLAEVLTAFPDRKFLINFKSRWREEGRMLARYLRDRGISAEQRVMAYGGDRPLSTFLAVEPESFGFTRTQTRDCTFSYLLLGWSGHVPDACRHGVIAVPVRYRHLFWGWPNRFLERMRIAHVTVIMMGEVTGDNGAPGITDPADLAHVPQGFGGIVWTDAVETVGPAWRERQRRQDAAQ